jgi:hypothetical protein
MFIKDNLVEYLFKMSFATMQDFTVGVFPFQDYNKTVYCYESAIQDNQRTNCTNITGMLPYEYFVVFLLQVLFPQTFCQNSLFYRD